jgi:hypothetical protein
VAIAGGSEDARGDPGGSEGTEDAGDMAADERGIVRRAGGEIPFVTAALVDRIAR